MPVVINGTTGIVNPDGSAATPSVAGTDTNTGVFFPAADTVAIATGGTERVRTDSSGNVGIGTSSPSYKLHVNGNIYSAGDTIYVGSTSTYVNYRSGNSDVIWSGGSGLFWQTNFSTGYHAWFTGNTERARIDSSGRFMIGTTSATGYLTVANNPGDGALVVHFTRPGVADSVLFYAANAYSPNGAAATIRMGSISSTGRSINAGGTINASGADYAEYMTKAGDFTIAKGDVCGIDANGKLTNVFADAVAFVVKSTDPSYVGGDRWGTADALGVKEPAALTGEATEEDKAQYEVDKTAFDVALEAARQKVDRIAFSGQVPVNVLGATPGQYIVPVDDNGSIKGVAKNEADLTLAEYMKAVGKVIAVEADGRAKIIVKVA